jgi:hypothetical protein
VSCLSFRLQPPQSNSPCESHNFLCRPFSPIGEDKVSFYCFSFCNFCFFSFLFISSPWHVNHLNETCQTNRHLFGHTWHESSQWFGATIVRRKKPWMVVLKHVDVSAPLYASPSNQFSTIQE